MAASPSDPGSEAYFSISLHFPNLSTLLCTGALLAGAMLHTLHPLLQLCYSSATADVDCACWRTVQPAISSPSLYALLPALPAVRPAVLICCPGLLPRSTGPWPVPRGVVSQSIRIRDQTCFGTVLPAVLGTAHNTSAESIAAGRNRLRGGSCGRPACPHAFLAGSPPAAPSTPHIPTPARPRHTPCKADAMDMRTPWTCSGHPAQRPRAPSEARCGKVQCGAVPVSVDRGPPSSTANLQAGIESVAPSLRTSAPSVSRFPDVTPTAGHRTTCCTNPLQVRHYRGRHASRDTPKRSPPPPRRAPTPPPSSPFPSHRLAVPGLPLPALAASPPSGRPVQPRTGTATARPTTPIRIDAVAGAGAAAGGRAPGRRAPCAAVAPESKKQRRNDPVGAATASAAAKHQKQL
eukprot:359920-Chlamydomonas_euryale.AAC.8